MSSKRCCVPQCAKIENSQRALHWFPNPKKDIGRFRTWVHAVGGNIISLSNEDIYKLRRVCHAHFEEKYCCRNNKISNIAVPTLLMPDISSMWQRLKRGVIPSQNIPFETKVPKPNVELLEVNNERAGKRTPTNYKESQATPLTSEETDLEDNNVSTKKRNVVQECGNDLITGGMKGMYNDHCYTHNSNDLVYYINDENLVPSTKNGSIDKQKQSNDQQCKDPIFKSLQYTPNMVACTVEVESTEDSEAPPAIFRICRICLAINVKMYRITDYQLSRVYQKVTGILLDTDDQLPKALCWECVGRLMSANRFRDKAVITHGLLASKASTTHMTIQDVISMNRCRYKLDSTLTVKHFGNNDMDLTICEDDAIKPVKVIEFHKSNFSDGNGDLPDKEMLEVKDKKIFVEEYADFAGEVSEEDKINRRNSIVESENGEDDILLEDSDDGTVDGVLKTKNIRKNTKVKVDKVLLKDISPSEAIKRYKSASVLRRKKKVTLDENLFTITTPTFDEQIAEIQKRTEMYSYKAAPYKCTACYTGFRTAGRYDNHALKHSESSGQYECFVCKARFKTAPPLRDHVTRQHSEKYSCNKCSFVTNNRLVARKHQNYHAGVKFQCSHCQKEFDKVSSYMGHLRIQHPTRFVCELCGFVFINQWGVDVHKAKKHRHTDVTAPLRGPHCEECGVRFLSEEAYARHLKLSAQHCREGDPDRIRNDPQCPPSGAARRRADCGPVGCEQCGVELASAKLYALHYRRQHAQPPRPMPVRCVCDQCGKTFQSSGLLKSHMWVHTGEKCFKCDRCAKSFTSKASLRLHAPAHGGARRTHACAQCGKQFTFRTNRERHMLIHTGLKPFACSACSKCFKTEAERRSHVDHVHLSKPWPKRTRAPAGARPPTILNRAQYFIETHKDH